MLTWIRGGLLIDGTERQPILDGALLVEDGVIKAAGPYGKLRAQFPTAPSAGEYLAFPCPTETIDLRPHTVLPGLIDSHIHLIGSPAVRSLWKVQQESDARLAIRAAANAQEALTAGITTLRDCGARGTVVRDLAQAIDDRILPGPRILQAGPPITTTAGHCYWFGLEAEGITGVQRAVRSIHKSGADFIKVMVTGGGLTPGSNTRVSQYSQAELDALVDDAHRLGHTIAGHAHGTAGIRQAVDAGFDFIEHCSWLAEDASQGRDYDPAVVEKMLQQGTVVCRTMAGFERVPLEEAIPEHHFWPDFEIFRRMVRAGVTIIAGTDAGIDHTPFDGLVRTLETMSGLGEMSPEAVLASSTRVAAEALGLSDVIGTLEPGKRADLISVTGNPLEDLRALRHAHAVIRDGVVVAQEGQIVRTGD